MGQASSKSLTPQIRRPSQVAPGAEIFHVQVADRENARGFGEIGANLRPDLRPAVIGGAEKGKDLRLHAGVLEAEVLLDDGGAVAQPVFKLARGFDHVHAGNDSERGEHGSQIGEERHRNTERPDDTDAGKSLDRPTLCAGFGAQRRRKRFSACSKRRWFR